MRRSALLTVCIAAVLCSVPKAVLAQASVPAAQKVLRVQAFGGKALPSGELAALQNLVSSYVVEMRLFRVIDAEGQEQALKEAEIAMQLGAAKDVAPLTADYLLSADASAIGGLIVFTMDLTKVSSGEKRNVAETFGSVNDLILAMRRLTRVLFERAPENVPSAQGGSVAQPAPAATAQAPGREATAASAASGPASSGVPDGTSGAAPSSPALHQSPNLYLAAGTWKGDKSVDRISLFPDGRGLAVLSTGATMKVRASISGKTIVVAQDQANAPEFYRSPGIDLKAAKAVAQAARRWRWIFALTADGNGLVGVKESVFVKIDDKGIVSVDNTYTRDAQWTRMFK